MSNQRGPIVLVLVLVLVGAGVYALGQSLVRQGYGQRPDPLLRLPTQNDHWHADLAVTICGEEQSVVPAGAGEVHSHGDGRIHIHPHSAATAGAAANLGLFFRTHGGTFSDDALRYPGSDRMWRNGDACPDGHAGAWTLLVNGALRTDFDRYIPQDGDRVEIRFQ